MAAVGRLKARRLVGGWSLSKLHHTKLVTVWSDGTDRPVPPLTVSGLQRSISVQSKQTVESTARPQHTIQRVSNFPALEHYLEARG